jgi:hypothetical protein
VLDDGVGVGVASAGGEVAGEAEVEFELDALRTEGRGVDVGTVGEEVADGKGYAEGGESVLGDVLDGVGELVVEVGEAEAGAAVEELLVEAAVIGAGVLGTERADMILGDGLGAVGLQREHGVERGGLLVEVGLLDALAEAAVELGSGKETGGRRADEVIGQRGAGGGGEAEEAVVFEAGAEVVEEAALEVAVELEGVAVVAALDGGECVAEVPSASRWLLMRTSDWA